MTDHRKRDDATVEPSRSLRHPQFHALHLTRALCDSESIGRIGHHAALLVVIVCHREDALHYSQPVRFWNAELMRLLGFSSPKQLTTARTKAIADGWLEYERQSDRHVGLYRTKIPDDAAIHSPRGTNRGKDSGTNHGTGSGMNGGKPSNPSPKPVPFPNPEEDVDGAKASSFKEDHEEIRAIERRIAHLAPPKNSKDQETIAKVATLVYRGQISQDDLEQVLESFRAKRDAGDRIKNPQAWFFTTMDNRCTAAGQKFKQLMAGCDVPPTVMEVRSAKAH